MNAPPSADATGSAEGAAAAQRAIELEATLLSQHLLEAAMLHAGLGTWTWDVATDRSVYSPSFFRILGIEPTGDMVADRARGIQCVVERDRLAVRAAVEAAAREGRTCQLRFQAVRADTGALIVLQSTAQPIEATGGRVVVGILQDVTDQVATLAGLRTAEGQADAIAHAIPDMVIRMRQDGLILDFEPALGSQATPEMFIGQNMMIASPAPPEVNAALMRGVRAAIASGEVIQTEVSASLPRWRTGDFECRIVRCAPDEVLILVRDITEQKAARLAVEAARSRAEEAVKARSAFLAMISHEMRTPLHGAVGLADQLAHEPLSASQRGLVEGIRSSGRALLALVDDLLDLSRIESGGLTLRPAPFALERLLDDTLAIVQPTAAARALSLQRKWRCEPGTTLVADGDRLRQIVLNLLSNALKFTDAGGVTLEASLSEPRDRAGHAELTIDVRDTGIGIAAEGLQRLMRPFVQLDPGATRARGGAGLGLAISLRLAERMGGTLTLTSELGVGTRAQLRLPVRLSQDWTHSTSPEASAARADVKVLVVEDNAINQVVIVEQLRALGVVEPTVAGSGEEALRHCSARDFDLVFMDLQLPDIDGYEVCRRLRASEACGRRSTVVALTAHALDDDPRACREAGMDGHLVKPVDVVAIAAWLDHARHAGPSPAQAG